MLCCSATDFKSREFEFLNSKVHERLVKLGFSRGILFFSDKVELQDLHEIQSSTVIIVLKTWKHKSICLRIYPGIPGSQLAQDIFIKIFTYSNQKQQSTNNKKPISVHFSIGCFKKPGYLQGCFKKPGYQKLWYRHVFFPVQIVKFSVDWQQIFYRKSCWLCISFA